MPKTTSGRKKAPAAEPPAEPPARTPPDAAPPDPTPIAAGPVTIQVSPQGHVIISVNPPPDAPLPPAASIVTLEAATAKGLRGWFGDEPLPEEARQPGPVREALDKLEAALRTLGEKVEEFATDVTTLEVRTFVSDRLDRLEDNFFTTAEPRALTRVDLDGDTDVVVPLDEGRLDETLWRIHADTVAQAQTHREAMLRTVLDLVRVVVPTIK